jgi:peptidoglycan/LPS O-acetylase OafA/YrhL
MFSSAETPGQVTGLEEILAHESEADMPSPKVFSRRIPELDGLRGTAVAMVLFFHYISHPIVPRSQGLFEFLFLRTRLFWCGVDLFFVLSGFLIGGILLDSRESPNYFKAFYIRRFCRIVPIYLLFITLVGIAHWLIYRPVGEPLNWVFAGKLPWYSYLSFAQNIWMVKQNTLGALVVVITWSLAVEEQFYLVLPAVIRFVRRSALPHVFLTGIWFAPILRIFIALRLPENHWAPYLLLPCRMDSLFLGALCAYYLRDPESWKSFVRRRTWMWIALVALLAGTLVMNDSPIALSMQSVGYDWIALLFTILLILALTDSESILGQILRWKWLRGFGTIAYSVYLFHMLVYGLCMSLLAGHGYFLSSWKDFGVTLVALGITITFAKLSWRYFENPIVRWGHTWQY